MHVFEKIESRKVEHNDDIKTYFDSLDKTARIQSFKELMYWQFPDQGGYLHEDAVDVFSWLKTIGVRI